MNISEIYTNAKELLEKADIDAVDICTTHDTHYQLTMDAAAGKHILLEKPMAIKMDDCREMIKKTDKAGVTFMIGQNLRYLPQSQTIYKMISVDVFVDLQVAQSIRVLY